ncbi:MAG: sensor domain-containing diguanylate cyclase [Amphritea sp.]
MRPADKENKELRRLLHLMNSKVERNQAILNSFFEMEIRLLGCTQLAELLDLILIEFREYFRLTTVNLILFDPENAARDLLEDYVPPEPGHTLRFVSNQRLLKEIFPSQKLLTGDLSSEQKRLAFPSSPFILSSALLPLVRHNYLIGSLHLGSNDPTRYSNNIDYDYVGHMASVIAVCIENCINQQNLKRLSIIDMLTKVHNRRAFDQEMTRELSRSSRANHPLSCLFVDLDHFKLVNDNYGHQAGDKVLRTAGLLLKKLLRKTDFVARYGGEEFAILLPNCEGDQAMQIADTIREKILKMIMHADNGEPFRISASIGVACCLPSTYEHTSQSDLARQLLKSADLGVYQAKQAGRNRCAFYPMPSNSADKKHTA